MINPITLPLRHIPTSPFLCALTDATLPPLPFVKAVLAGGATMIQLRVKEATTRELIAWGVEIRTLCHAAGACFIVNDRVDVALACGADGMHLGQQDMPCSLARKLFGKDMLIGVSASTVAEALQAEQDGADYIGFGHIYPTNSKEKPHPPVGLSTLQQVAKAISLPIVAIGGISGENASAVIEAGASGIAVIAALSKAENPTVAATKLCATMQGVAL